MLFSFHRSAECPSYELRFASRVRFVQDLAFPCDAAGHVDLDALSESARREYFYARVVMGREYAPPAVMPCARNRRAS